MTEKFNLSEVNIPYGILHDQKLKEVKCENNKLIFTFDIKIYPEDYTNEFYKTYLDYKCCDMIVYMNDEPFNYFSLIKSPDNHGKFSGLSLNREEFLNALNSSSEATFVECSTTYGEFTIELSIWYNKKCRYKKYNMCYALVDCKTVEWKWY